MFNDLLPISEHRSEIVESIRANQVTIVAGETGSGKTTQLPLMCLEAGRGSTGRIGCTQPRRIAAVSLAEFLCSTLGSSCGSSGSAVGYKVRFRDTVSESARIKFMTDGILLAEIAGDPDLAAYDTLIIDEAHERSVNIDFLLGYLRLLLPRRREMRLIIASATIDTNLFSRNFGNAPIITVSGRLFPVDIQYRPVIELWQGQSIDGYIEGILQTVREIMATGQDGDILVFLPTIQDIQETALRMRQLCTAWDLELFQLHSRIGIAGQSRIFKRHATRAIILATNIAETSITVPGVRFVIDSGLARVLRYDLTARISRMPVVPVSRASADQRAGRCGRVRDGIAYRLYSPGDYESRPLFTRPEIQRANLAGVILRMTNLRLGHADKFPFLQRPAPNALREGYRQLIELGALDHKHTLTSLGRRMAQLPLDPPVARMLLYAAKHGGLREVMIIAAGLSAEDPRLHPADQTDEATIVSPKKFKHPESDFLTLVNIWDAMHENVPRNPSYQALVSFCRDAGLSVARVREWVDAFEQIKRICHGMFGHGIQRAKAPYDSIHMSLLSGLVYNLALRDGDGSYTGISTPKIMIFPASALFKRKPQWVLFHEIVETSRIFGRTAAVIRPEWVEKLFGDRCRYSYEDAHFDGERGTVLAREQVTFQGMVLIRNRTIELSRRDREAASAIFIREALVGELAGQNIRFMRQNRESRNFVLLAQKKLRTTALYAGDEALGQFYEERLGGGVVSLRELYRKIAQRGGDQFLIMGIEHLLCSELPEELSAYPDELFIAGRRIAVTYQFTPGDDGDGASITISPELYDAVPGCYWGWIPGIFLRKRVEIFCAAIIHGMTTGDVPDLQEKVDAVLQHLDIVDGPFLRELCRAAGLEFGLTTMPEEIPDALFPPQLWLNVRVVDDRKICVKTVRANGWTAESAPDNAARERAALWAPYCISWEREHVAEWDFECIPERVTVRPSLKEVAVTGFPALAVHNGKPGIRVFFAPWKAFISHERGIEFLAERQLAEQMSWELESLKIPRALQDAQGSGETAPGMDAEAFVARWFHLRVLESPDILPYSKCGFERHVSAARDRIAGGAREVLELYAAIVDEIKACNNQLQRMRERYTSPVYDYVNNDLSNDFARYLQMHSGQGVSFGFVSELPAMLHSLLKRIESGYPDPARYRSKMGRVHHYRERLHQAISVPWSAAIPYRRAAERVELMIESYAAAQFSFTQPRTARDPVSGELIEAELKKLIGTLSEADSPGCREQTLCSGMHSG